MQKIFPYLIFLLVCSSCTKYQYSTVSSNAEKSPDGTHLFENDSMQVRYNFKGKDCPFTISIFNKLSVPLYVDWKKSSVIIDQQRFPLWIDQAEIKSSTNGNTLQWTDFYSTSHSSTAGTLTRSESMSFIPPQSFVSMKPVILQNKLFKLQRKTSNKVLIQTSSSSTPVSGLEYTFQKENSPLAFKSFLVLSTDENAPSPLYVEHQFWVSYILETMLSPKQHHALSGNQFITSKTTGTGNVLAITAGCAVLVAVTAAEVATENK